MAGYRNEQLRKIVHAYLTDPDNRDASDRQAAAETGVHRQIVVEVRRGLIAAGTLPDKDYKPYAAARGGYVWDDRGRQVREADAVVTEAGKLSRQAGRAFAEVLRVIRSRHQPKPKAAPATHRAGTPGKRPLSRHR